MSKTRIIAVSGVVMAMYVVLMYLTQGFAFGAYQIRIATGLYSLSYIFPFLVIPLGIANGLSNFLGGMGFFDVAGGVVVGLVTGGAVYLIRKLHLPSLLIIPVIVFGPGLIVPIWLVPILVMPYHVLALSLCIGQLVPAVTGFLLVKALPRLTPQLLHGGVK